jgi:hypothetical protein
MDRRRRFPSSCAPRSDPVPLRSLSRRLERDRERDNDLSRFDREIACERDRERDREWDRFVEIVEMESELEEYDDTDRERLLEDGRALSSMRRGPLPRSSSFFARISSATPFLNT